MKLSAFRGDDADDGDRANWFFLSMACGDIATELFTGLDDAAATASNE